MLAQTVAHLRIIHKHLIYRLGCCTHGDNRDERSTLCPGLSKPLNDPCVPGDRLRRISTREPLDRGLDHVRRDVSGRRGRPDPRLRPPRSEFKNEMPLVDTLGPVRGRETLNEEQTCLFVRKGEFPRTRKVLRQYSCRELSQTVGRRRTDNDR